MKVISLNMAGWLQPWKCLLDMDVDLALLQEATEPPADVAERIRADPAIEVDAAPWETKIVGARPRYRTAIVKLSNRIELDRIEAKPLEVAGNRELVASWPGTLAAAVITPPSGNPLIAISMYAPWVSTHASADKRIFADGSAHHVVSDLSTFIANREGHRILAAGDLNILRGYGEYGEDYLAMRHKTVFDRMDALGLPCVGPEYPNGRQADPWPEELPRDSRNVPTHYSPGRSPERATRQLDYVFASAELADALTVRALNEPGEWGPSDHCRIVIEFSLGD